MGAPALRGGPADGQDPGRHRPGPGRPRSGPPGRGPGHASARLRPATSPRSGPAACSVTLATIEEICREADFITVHTPLDQGDGRPHRAARVCPDEAGRRHHQLRPGRHHRRSGPVWPPWKSGKVAGAALDVFTEEPPGGQSPARPGDVIATPHLGASTHEAQVNVAVDVARDRGAGSERASRSLAPSTCPALRPGERGRPCCLTWIWRSGWAASSRELFGGGLGRVEIVYSGEVAALRRSSALDQRGLSRGCWSPCSKSKSTT